MMKLFVCVCLALLDVSSFAGSIDDDLFAYLDEMAENDKVFCMIVMIDQFDVAAFKQVMTMANSTRQERHNYVISRLREIATNSQANLLAELNNSQKRGEVGEYINFWITNAIQAKLSKIAILRLADRGDVATIHLWNEPELIKPVENDSEPPAINSVERGLEVIGAPEMWELGYTGAGRLVANIDTGVDGNHPALHGRWRGNNGAPPEECWLDTANPSNDFPYDTDGHGTHTMGTITGLGETSGDTIGVAHGALWIASRAIVSGGNSTAAFQWLVDPDGDPTTIDDVPDAIGNSWGYHDFSCPTYNWNSIDNCEAAGIVVVFAAGNRYQGDPYDESMWAPASRNTSDYNSFSVGAVNGNSDSFPIADFSARGPSQCDHVTIKPEVVAPGVNVRSSVPGGGYQSTGWSGTSMATPHVAGAVALLRQFNPNASVDTIKWALIQSCGDLGHPDEDNTYGHGIINVREALDFMPGNEIPNIYLSNYQIYEPNDNHPDPGEEVELVVTLSNSGTAATNVSARILTESPFGDIIQDSAFFGDIGAGESADNDGQRFEIIFDEETPEGYRVPLVINIFADGYETEGVITIQVGHPGDPEIAHFDIGACDFTISNFGQYGLEPTDLNPDWAGQGYKTPRFTANYLFEGALLIGDGPTRVSNGARDQDQLIESDFIPISGIARFEPGEDADLEYSCSFNDQAADEPLNISVNQTCYGWIDSPDNTYIITKYDITNDGDTDLVGVRVAHFEDWDMPWGVANDRANFDRERNLGYQYYTTSYRGVMVLNPEGAVSFKALSNENEVYPPLFTLADKWNYMNADFTDTAITTPEDASIMMTTGPWDIPFGASVTAAFAILGGNSLEALQEVADAATQKYYNMTDIADQPQPGLPLVFGIAGNYPNPFNPTTIIKFSIARPAQVELEIYDILGRKVNTLISGFKTSGAYEITWNSRDSRGRDVASGMYFIKLQSGQQSSVEKMMLLR
ncbi:MAG: S8 family serine peptidase [candidate division Zixibacteria bacterium]|nr:S8 family serine peptidase [candidate division Zixibacteria bacterium]